MGYQSLAEKLSQVSHLVEIAKADGHINLAEISYIFWTAQQFQLSELELKRLFEKTAPLAVPISTPERVDVFYTCLVILAIDNQMVEPEFIKCTQIGKDLRLDTNKISTAFELLRQKNGTLLSLAELRSHFGV